MYTEYNSQNVENNNIDYDNYKDNNNIDYDNYKDNNNNIPKKDNFSKDPNIYVTEEEPSNGKKILSMIWKILLVIIILIVLFLVLIQMGVIKFGSDIAPEVVLLNQNEVGLKRGATYQLVHSVLPDNSTNKQVVFVSSDPSVVEVNEATGFLTAKKNGTATITVKTLINEKISECVVTVGNKTVAATGIRINEKNINLAVKNNSYLSYRMVPSNSNAGSLIFSSSDTSVATVNQKGMVTAVKPGNAVITVSSIDGSIKDTAYVTVYEKGSSTVVAGESISTTNYPTSVKLNTTSMNLTIGSTSQLVGTVSPSSASRTLNWSSSNTNIVTVNQNGLVTARAKGTATVVAKTINGKTATCTITVGNYSNKLKSIIITTKYAVVPAGRTKQLIVAFTPSTATNKTVTWTSNNTGVATVDGSGIVTAIAPGTAIITARAADGGYTYSTTIDVVKQGNSKEVTGISFSASNYSIGTGSTTQLSPIITPSDASYKGVEFESSDTSVATVDINGVVTGMKAGVATITATTKRNHLQAKVTVTVSDIAVKSISLNSTNVTIKVSGGYTLVPTILPTNATKKTVTFKSENSKVATVDKNGNITGVGVGTTTITVQGNGASATCIVNVTAK